MSLNAINTEIGEVFFNAAPISEIVFNGDTLWELVTINTPPAVFPIGSIAGIGMTEDTPLTVDISSYIDDAEGDAWVVSATETLQAADSSGTLDYVTTVQVIGTKEIVITPMSNYHGASIINIEVTDDGLTSVYGTISVSIAPVNDAPTLISTPITYYTDENVSISITDLMSNVIDVDTEDTLTLNSSYLVSAEGASLDTTWYNALVRTGNTLNFLSPQLNYNGLVTISYSIYDGTTSVGGTLLLNVQEDAVRVAEEAAAAAAIAAASLVTPIVVSAQQVSAWQIVNESYDYTTPVLDTTNNLFGVSLVVEDEAGFGLIPSHQTLEIYQDGTLLYEFGDIGLGTNTSDEPLPLSKTVYSNCDGSLPAEVSFCPGGTGFTFSIPASDASALTTTFTVVAKHNNTSSACWVRSRITFRIFAILD